MQCSPRFYHVLSLQPKIEWILWEMLQGKWNKIPGSDYFRTWIPDPYRILPPVPSSIFCVILLLAEKQIKPTHNLLGGDNKVSKEDISCLMHMYECPNPYIKPDIKLNKHCMGAATFYMPPFDNHVMRTPNALCPSFNLQTYSALSPFSMCHFMLFWILKDQVNANMHP